MCICVGGAVKMLLLSIYKKSVINLHFFCTFKKKKNQVNYNNLFFEKFLLQFLHCKKSGVLVKVKKTVDKCLKLLGVDWAKLRWNTFITWCQCIALDTCQDIFLSSLYIYWSVVGFMPLHQIKCDGWCNVHVIQLRGPSYEKEIKLFFIAVIVFLWWLWLLEDWLQHSWGREDFPR